MNIALDASKKSSSPMTAAWPVTIESNMACAVDKPTFADD